MRLANIINKLRKKDTVGADKKLKKGKTKIKDKRNRHIFVLKMLSFFVMFLLLLGIILTIIFVYSSITNTIGQIQSIVTIQTEGNIQLINFGKLDKIEKYWEDNINTELPVTTRNPFIEVAPPPAPEVETEISNETDL